jgi:hypothetical protein
MEYMFERERVEIVTLVNPFIGVGIEAFVDEVAPSTLIISIET